MGCYKDFLWCYLPVLSSVDRRTHPEKYWSQHFHLAMCQLPTDPKFKVSSPEQHNIKYIEVWRIFGCRSSCIWFSGPVFAILKVKSHFVLSLTFIYIAISCTEQWQLEEVMILGGHGTAMVVPAL